jgi:hypothetical protein
MLQAYAPGQNFVSGKHIVSYDGGGTVLSDFTFPSNVSNGANQATILVATSAIPGADFIAGNGATGLEVVNTGGTVCFTDSSITAGLDCVAYVGGNAATFPDPAPSPFGTPLSVGGSNLDGKSIVRKINADCATALDKADDTNNSAADFALAAPIARGNATAPTETSCPAVPAKKKKCKKKKKKKSGAYSAKKKCKKKHKK